MASKMSAAVDDDSNKITISIAESLNYKKPLRCEFCDAQVNFVNGYPRELGEKIIYVKSFFRLKSGFKHNIACEYNIEGQIKVIARESEGNILAPTESGRFELRLLAAKKAIKELQELVRSKNKSDSKSTNTAKEKKYIKSKKRLGSYINSALRVLKVRGLCEDNSEIENLLELVFDGSRLPWRNFYYEEDDYFKCHSYLKKSTVTVPVAIKGIIKSIEVVNGKNKSFTVINLIGPYRKSGQEEIMDSANVSVWSPNLDAFNGYSIDDEIIAFGIWDYENMKKSSNNNSKSPIKIFCNYNLRLWPISKTQLCKVSN